MTILPHPRHGTDAAETGSPGNGHRHRPDETSAPDAQAPSIESPVESHGVERESPATDSPAEDESADPVGDGHSDADLADRLSRP